MKKITLSHEELFYLVRALKIPDLQDMIPPSILGLPEDVFLLMMEIVGRSLISNKKLDYINQTISVPTDIASVLSQCSNYEKILKLEIQEGINLLNHIIYRNNLGDIVQDEIYPSIFEFSQEKKIYKSIVTIIGKLKPYLGKNLQTTYFVPADSIVDIVRNDQISDQDKVQRLEQYSIPKKDSEDFIALLKLHELKFYYLLITGKNETAVQRYATVYVDESTVWVIAPDPTKEGTMLIKKNDCESIIKDLQEFATPNII